MFWRLKGCNRCTGDLVMEEDSWRCWQCGHYYYPNVSQPSAHSSEPVSARQSHSFGRKKNGYGERADRNINSMIRAKRTSDESWWTRNQRIITFLDGGWPVRDIALVTGRGARQIRVVREKLIDLRVQAEVYRHRNLSNVLIEARFPRPSI